MSQSPPPPTGGIFTLATLVGSFIYQRVSGSITPLHAPNSPSRSEQPTLLEIDESFFDERRATRLEATREVETDIGNMIVLTEIPVSHTSSDDTDSPGDSLVHQTPEEGSPRTILVHLSILKRLISEEEEVEREENLSKPTILMRFNTLKGMISADQEERMVSVDTDLFEHLILQSKEESDEDASSSTVTLTKEAFEFLLKKAREACQLEHENRQRIQFQDEVIQALIKRARKASLTRKYDQIALEHLKQRAAEGVRHSAENSIAQPETPEQEKNPLKQNSSDQTEIQSPQALSSVVTFEQKKTQWIKIALTINVIVVAFFFIFTALYCSGHFTFDVFVGRVGIAISLFGAILVTILSGTAFCLGFRHVDRMPVS